MDEITTPVLAAIGAYASKDMIKDLLGPSAQYIGGELEGLIKKCKINLLDIFGRACKKAGDNLTQPGSVNTRILRQVLLEGGYCEEDIVRDYFAGVLAGSKSALGDDRGLTFIKLITGLSSSQIRSHYVFYNIFRKLYKGNDFKVTLQKGREHMKTFVPQTVFNHAMKFNDGRFNLMWPHVAYGLKREELIGFYG